MQKEIGSNFWLDINRISMEHCDLNMERYGVMGNDCVFLSSGRFAIKFALDDIKRNNPDIIKNALIPPFTCETVVKPFLYGGFLINAYEIGENLYLTGDMLKESINRCNAKIVLLHRYFGFNTITDDVIPIIKEYRKKGVMFIEDRTQNLFSEFSSLPVDYIVGSFRKWAAIPDGGYCVKVEGSFDQHSYIEDSALAEAKLRAFSLKNSYMEHDYGSKDVFLKAFAYAESLLNDENSYYNMSDVSKRILVNLGSHGLAKKRRENYEYLWERLSDFGKYLLLTEKIDEESVPLYLAICDVNRDDIQLMLRNEAIYAPIVWPKSSYTPEIGGAAQRLYDEILCIPIDQRYDLDDMRRVVNILSQ